MIFINIKLVETPVFDLFLTERDFNSPSIKHNKLRFNTE